VKNSLDLTLLTIDPDSVVPLYHQIKQNIRDLIENEVLNDGDLLPSERELGEIYGVNRLTVRQALNDLVNEGMLQRQRGIGTFVAVPKVTQVIDRVLGFSDRIQEAGHTPSSRMISIETVPLALSVARRLALQPRLPAYKLVRLRCVDGEPVMLETAYLPVTLFPRLEAADLSNQSLYNVLSEKYNCSILEAEEQLEPVLLTDYEAGMLEVEPGTPGMLVESTSFNQYGKPVEFGKAVVRGDRARFMFHIRRTANEH
jgi:GntR family transcriptional regulator